MTFTLLDVPQLFGLSIEVYIICFIIALATFFVCRRLLKMFVKTDKTRKIATWSITLLATPLIYLGLIRLLVFWITYMPGRAFDKSQWLTDREGRFQMAGDIIKSKMLIGKDTNQIKQLLGDPTWRNDTTYQAELKNSWFYDMGMGGGGLGFMFHNLIVKFDKNKVVVVEHGKTQD
jgi:hypothetical protein